MLPLGLMVVVSATDRAIPEKIYGSGMKNMLPSKAKIPAHKRIIRAGDGTIRAVQDF